MTGRLLLIGMPAAGKTTVGTRLAEALALPFFDSDALVEQAAGQTIPRLFAQEGERAFRCRERQVLEELCCGAEHCVIATGGGVVLLPENRTVLRRSGTVFWLDRSLSNIMSTEFACGRPLLTAGEPALRALYDARKELYEACAHYRVPDGTVQEMSEYILRIWRETP